jgi:hypothetical protein
MNLKNEEFSAVQDPDIQTLVSRVRQDSELRRLTVEWIGLEALSLDASFPGLEILDGCVHVLCSEGIEWKNYFLMRRLIEHVQPQPIHESPWQAQHTASLFVEHYRN